MPSFLQLQYFVELARRGNMTDVANKNFITQSALSNALLRLEKELGVQIFDRVGRNLVLNEYGQIYLSHVEPALFAINEGKRAIEQMDRSRRKKVSVAMSTALHLGELIRQFLQEYPQYTFSQCNYTFDDKGSFPDTDFIIAGAGDLPSSEFEHTVFREDKIWLRVPPDNPLAQKGSIYLAEAKNEHFINPPKTASFTRFLDYLFKQAGFTPKIVTECDSDLQERLLRQNMGVLLFPETVVQSGFFDYGVDLLVKDDFAVRRHCLYWAKNKDLSGAAIAFRDFLLTPVGKEQ